jgi:hypothetical protein
MTPFIQVTDALTLTETTACGLGLGMGAGQGAEGELGGGGFLASTVVRTLGFIHGSNLLKLHNSNAAFVTLICQPYCNKSVKIKPNADVDSIKKPRARFSKCSQKCGKNKRPS